MCQNSSEHKVNIGDIVSQLNFLNKFSQKTVLMAHEFEWVGDGMNNGRQDGWINNKF